MARAFAQTILCTSCSADISIVKMATVSFALSAALTAISMASAVFPIDGRPAMIMKSDGCKPEVRWSSFVKPVDTPEATPLSW